MLPKNIDTWLLTSVQQQLVKTGGRLVMHAGTLVTPGEASSDAATIREHAATDCGATASRRVAEVAGGAKPIGQNRGKNREVSEKSAARVVVPALEFSEEGMTGLFQCCRKHSGLKPRHPVPCEGGLV